MEKKLVPNSTTLASLRRLLRAARKNTAEKEAVCINLTMWHYNFPSLKEVIGVYRSGTGEGTQEFSSVKEARKYIDGWKEEENGSDT